MGTARDAAIAVIAVALSALIKVVWGLAGRVSKIEGRLNGKKD